MNIHEKLGAIQRELKAPKNQFNDFGKYKYRSLEDILEAVKPLLFQKSLTMIIKDEPVQVGNRLYIKAEATIFDMTTDVPNNTIVATAYAREAETKKGMDDSQITGSTSSYARKYCLNGLFLIDDTKDADSMDNNQKPAKAKTTKSKEPLTFLEEMKHFAQINYKAYKSVLDDFQVDSAKSITDAETQKQMLTVLRRM